MGQLSALPNLQGDLILLGFLFILLLLLLWYCRISATDGVQD
jgi:hypothetical protein